MMTSCQSNPPFGTSPATVQIGCRLNVDGMTPSEMETPARGITRITKRVTTLLPVDLKGFRACQDTCTQKPLEPLLEKAWIWGLQTPFASHYPQVQTKHPCSELRKTKFQQATRFNSHTFCLFHNTYPVFLERRISDRQFRLHHPFRFRHWVW